jgi:formate dehydrogenase major subunit
MTFHFPDQVDTNVLTIDATDPRSGTAEFKATAIRVEKLPINGDRDAVPAAVAAGNGDGAGQAQDVRA